MKKFILFITAITLSFGSAWAESWQIINSSYTSTIMDTHNEIPFDVNATTEQHIQLIYPSSLFRGTNGSTTNYFIFDYIYGITFTATTSSTLNETYLKNRFNISVKLLSYAGSLPTSFVDVTGITAKTCTLSTSEKNMILSFPKFEYKSTDDFLVVDLNITLNTSQTFESQVVSWEANRNYHSLRSTNGSTTADQINYLPKTSFNCCRKIMGVVYDECAYDVYTSGLGSAYASLKEYHPGSSGSAKDRCFTYNPTNNPSNNNNFILEEYLLYKMPDFVKNYSINGETAYDIAVKKIECNIGSFLTISQNTAFIFPAGIETFGSNDCSNECFNFGYSPYSMITNNLFNVAIILQSTPELLSKNDDFSKFISLRSISGSQTKVVNIYQTINCSTSITSTSWNSHLQNVIKTGYVSNPYLVEYYNAYNKTSIIKNNSQEPIYIYQLPFGNNFYLKIKIGDKPYGSSDGSFHILNNMHVTVSPTSIELNPTNGIGTDIISNLTQDAVYTITTDYDARLMYSNGDPNFNYASDHDKVSINNEVKLFNGSPTLTFKLYRTDAGYFNDNVPYWIYKNTQSVSVDDPKYVSAPETINANTRINVEKGITSAHYRYFSFPFDVPIKDISVKNMASGNTINFLEESISSTQTFNNDCFIIEEYQGQFDAVGDDSLPNYVQILDKNAILSKNKGYAFAIVESDANLEAGTTVNALITFKSHADNEPNVSNTFYINTYDNHSIALIHKGKSNRNKGWNMIGNPFYHYLNASSFYGEDNSSNKKQIKYITLIKDDESVEHMWVNDNGLIETAKPSANVLIKPFEAFFVQVEDDVNSITVHPGSIIANQPYPQSMENEIIQEFLSVRIMDNDSVFDKTTIINDDNRDEHFALMDDLAKIMNSGIQIYTWYDATPCAFKELPLRADSSMTIPLGVRATESGNYTFSLDTSLTLFYGAVMLHDKQNNQYYPLNENGVQISLNEGENNTRFEIVVIPSEIPAELEDVETSETLDAYVHDGSLVVENIAEGSVLSIYDISGKLVYTAPAAGDVNYDFNAHGVYMVVLRGNTTGTIKVVY